MFPASLSPPPLLPSFSSLLGTTLFGCPSIIHTHISINIQASRFPVARVRSAAVRRTPASQPARPERPFIDGTIRSIFAPLYNNYILSATATAQREKPNGSHSPRATTTTTTPSEATKVPPTRVAREKKRQWSSKRLKPYWYLLCIFVYSINSEVLGNFEQNPFVCS